MNNTITNKMKYILCSCYEGRFDTNIYNFICVGSKKTIQAYIVSKYKKNIHDFDILFKDYQYEINADIMLFLEQHRVGYCLMAFCPGGSNELEWFDNIIEATQKYNSIVKELKNNTDDEYVYSINLYKTTNKDFILLHSDTAPYM